MKRKFIIFFLISIFVFSLIGCTSKTSNKQNSNINTSNNTNQNKITVNIAGLKGPTSIGMIKMFDEKPSLGKNITSIYTIANTPDILVAKLIKKEVDIAALPTNVASKMYNKTNGAYKLAAVNTFGMLYLVTNNIEINSWNDLKGKKINIIGKGSTPDYVFNYLLKKNGINTEKDVNLDYSLSQAELAQAVAANKVNIAVLPEPFVTMVTMKNKNVKISMNLQDEWKNIQGEDSPIAMGCVVVRSDFAKAHPEAVNTYLNKYENSINWVNKNPEKAGVLVQKFGVLNNAKLTEKAIPNCNIRFLDASKAKNTVNAFLNILYNFTPSSIGGKLPDEGFFYKK